MGLIGKDFTYKKIKNFLTKDEVKLLSNYCEIRHRNNTTGFDESKEMGIPDSRFYGGIHTPQDNEVGLEQGTIIGKNIINLNWKK